MIIVTGLEMWPNMAWFLHPQFLRKNLIGCIIMLRTTHIDTDTDTDTDKRTHTHRYRPTNTDTHRHKTHKHIRSAGPQKLFLCKMEGDIELCAFSFFFFRKPRVLFSQSLHLYSRFQVVCFMWLSKTSILQAGEKAVRPFFVPLTSTHPLTHTTPKG